MTQAEKFYKETGIAKFLFSKKPDGGIHWPYVVWLETKCDTLEAQIIGLHAEIARLTKELEAAKKIERERWASVPAQFITSKREKERGQ